MTYEEKKLARAQRQDPTRISIAFDPLQQRMSGRAIHGDTPFDCPFISHIPGAYGGGNLYMGGCKGGLVLPDEIKNLVSLYPWESYVLRHELDSVLVVRALDSTDQAFDVLDQAALWASKAIGRGPTLIHCQAGLNRSGYTAARALMYLGESADAAISRLREARSPAVLCNTAFEEHLRSL